MKIGMMLDIGIVEELIRFFSLRQKLSSGQQDVVSTVGASRWGYLFVYILSA